MSQNRLEKNLQSKIASGGKCLMPYLTAGFPDLDTTVRLIERFDSAGCPAIEVGFPFSDSIADGPVIQESFYHALDNGFRVDALLEAIGNLRSRVSTALVAMVSMSLVAKRGVERFARDVASAGFDAMIVPDVPVDEADAVTPAAESAGLCNVLMEAPTSSQERRKWIASKSRGFLYVIASRGITGERQDVSGDLAAHVQAMRSLTDVPLIVGFGINTPEHVREVCRSADGAIVGSAIVRRITKCIEESASADAIVDTLGAYIDELAAAAH